MINFFHFKEIFKQYLVANSYDFEVNNITNDSRKVQVNSIFFLLNPANEKYIAEVVAKGGYYIASENQNLIQKNVIICHNIPIRKLYSLFIAEFYRLNKLPLKICAVTGTNGKSSVCFFYKQLCNLFYLKAATIGTIGVYSDDIPHQELSLTTPDAEDLYKIIYDRAQNKIYDIVIEASSHGLDQYRLDGLPIAAIAFTNFTHDHLDYHQNLENYWQAKARIFNEIATDKTAIIINYDDPKSEEILKICCEKQLPYFTYGQSNRCDIQIIDYTIDYNFTGTVTLKIFNKIYRFPTNLFGKFQIYNLAASIGLLIANYPNNYHKVFTKINLMKSPPGRMEVIKSKNGLVIIDYAHSPDALKTALSAIKTHLSSMKLIVVFGCGGDRDKEKRPKMGEIATNYSDLAIITDDNPRSEDPAEIRKEIINGTKSNKLKEIADRYEAIKYAISLMDGYPIILIAGKGHENKQIIGQDIYEFNDYEVAKNLINV